MILVFGVAAIGVSLGVWAIVGELKRLRVELSRIAGSIERERNNGQ